MVLNGILAGLVGITAGADQMAMGSVLFFDKVKIDDPVGAISVHLACGIRVTLGVGLFGGLAGGAQIVSQLNGIISIGFHFHHRARALHSHQVHHGITGF